MLEEIIYYITRSILAGNLPDTGALESYFGSYGLVDEIVNGITRAIVDQGDDDRLAEMRSYEG
jgi:hypothetical protein